MARTSRLRRWVGASRTAVVCRAIADAGEMSLARRLRRQGAGAARRLVGHVDGALARCQTALRGSRAAVISLRLTSPIANSLRRIGAVARSSLLVASLHTTGSRGLGLALLVGLGTNALLLAIAGEAVGPPGWVVRGSLLVVGIGLLAGALTWPMLRDARFCRWLLPPRQPERRDPAED